jgi:hypothetical protein
MDISDDSTAKEAFNSPKQFTDTARPLVPSPLLVGHAGEILNCGRTPHGQSLTWRFRCAPTRLPSRSHVLGDRSCYEELVGEAPGWYPDPLVDLPLTLEADHTRAVWVASSSATEAKRSPGLPSACG